MTEKSRPPTENVNLLPWMSLVQAPPVWAVFGDCARASQPVVRSAACAQLQMSSLVGRRVMAWAGIPETLMRCRTPMDVFQAQLAFWQEAGRNYSEASQQVMAAWRTAMPGLAQADGEGRVEPRDYITFPEPKADTAGEERRHPGEARRAA